MQLHQGDARSGERLSFRDQVSPSLLSHVLELDHPSRFWACYKVARRASMMVSGWGHMGGGKGLKEMGVFKFLG